METDETATTDVNADAADRPVITESGGSDKVRVDAELTELGSLIRSTPALAFLKPRLAKMIGGELDYAALLSFYRIISKMFKEELDKKAEQQQTLEKEIVRLRDKQEALKQEILKQEVLRAAMPVEVKKAPTPPPEDLVNKAELEKKDKEIAESGERLERMKEDFTNYRNRVKLDTELQIHRSREDWLRKVLSVGDNFDRALVSAKSATNIEALLTGVQMIQRQLLDILTDEGVVEIETTGKPFNPKFHECLLREESADVTEETVVEELQKGYLLSGKVLRPAMVKVAVPAPGAPSPPKGEATGSVDAKDENGGNGADKVGEAEATPPGA
ncbi:MAG: nucleotide exchange factor GrpE [Candidatus Xenobia bacterium]